VLAADMTQAGFSGSGLWIDGAEAFRIDLTGGGTVDLAYDKGSDTLSVTGTTGASSSTALVIEDLNGTDLRIDQVTIAQSLGSLTSDANIGTLTMLGDTNITTVTIGGGQGTIGLLDGQGKLLTDMTVNADVTTITIIENQAVLTINGDVDTFDVNKFPIGSEITVNGTVGSFINSGSADIVGNLTVSNDLGSLTIGKLQADGSLVVGANLGSWVGTDVDSPVVIGGDVGTLSFDKVNADITITGDLESLTVNTVLSTATITVEQVVGTLVFSVGGTDYGGTYAIPVVYVFDGASQTASVTPANVVPVISVTGAATISVGQVYTLNLSASAPVDSWTINWGDGTIDTIAGNLTTATHTYTVGGLTNNITVSATDAYGTYYDSSLIIGNAATGADGFLLMAGYDPTTGLADLANAQILNTPTPSDLDWAADVIVGPNGDIYATGYESGNVVRFDGTTGAFVEEFVTTTQPVSIAFGPDGNLYVASDLGHVKRFDGTTGAYIDDFLTLGFTPEEMTFGDDGNLYIGQYNPGRIYRFDGETGAPIDGGEAFIDPELTGTTADDINYSEQFAFGPDGNIYVASMTDGKIQRYDGTTGDFIDTFANPGLNGAGWPRGPTGVAFGPDGHLYVTTVDRVERYDGTTGLYIDDYIPVGSGLDNPWFSTFTPNHQVTVIADAAPTLVNNAGLTAAEGSTTVITNTQLGYTDAQQPASSIVYTVTSAPANGQLELTTNPGVAISSFTQAQIDAGEVVYVHDGSETTADSFGFTVDDGQGNYASGPSIVGIGTLTNVTNGISNARAPDYSPDGSQVVFSRNNDIYIMNADGSNQTLLTSSIGGDFQAVWSPDGTKIAFTSNRDGNNEIYVINVDGTNETRLTNHAGSDSAPAWSPDGTKIAFTSERDGDGDKEIWVMDADGTNLVQLTANTATDGGASWSPDGSKIVFQSTRDGGDYEIYVMDANGANQTRLTSEAGIDALGDWSPDGSKLLFYSERDSNREIYVMDADGSNQVRLTNDAGIDMEAEWSPDGSSILFSSNRDTDYDIYSANVMYENTFAISVTPVNDAPTAANNTVVTNEDTDYVFTAADFNFSDVDGDTLASVQITSLESAGSLQLSGVDVTLNQVISKADIDAGNLTFTPAADANGAGYASFGFSVNDGTVDSASSYTMTVDVTAANDAPAGLPVVTGTITEDEVLTADTGGISDADGLGAFTYQWLRNGVAISGATASTYTLGDADVGTQISVRVDYVDGDGFSESLTSAQTVAVANVNDPPVISIDPSPILYLSGTMAVDPNLTVSDVDNATLQSAQVSFGDGYLRGQDRLLFTDQLGITGSFDLNTGILTLTGSASVADYQTALRSVQYEDFNPTPAEGILYVDFSVSDGTDTSAVDTRVLEIVDNMPPRAADDFGTAAEGGSVVIDLAANDTDADDALDLTSIVITSGPANGSVVVNGDGTVTYTHNGSETASDSFTYTIRDIDGNLSNEAPVSITVTAVNDNPVAVADTYTVGEDATLNSNSGWFDSNWQYSRTLAFDNSTRTENLVDFPVLVKLDSNVIDYAKTHDQGWDLRFFDQDGTALAHEIELWDEAGTSYVWVKIPQIDASSSTDSIVMYYGNAGVADSGEDAAGVWSDYRATYHLNENPGATGTVSDSAGNFDAVNAGSTDTAGIIGSAQDFDGAGQYIDLGDDRAWINNASGASLSIWMNPDTTTGSGDLIGLTRNDPADTGASRITLIRNGDDIQLIARTMDDSSDSVSVTTTTNPLSAGSWHHITGTVDYSSDVDNIKIYVDGQLGWSQRLLRRPARRGKDRRPGALGRLDFGAVRGDDR
jgi:Tol biopolymer transport system component